MVNRIVFLVIVLASLIWLAASLEFHEQPAHKPTAATISAARDSQTEYQTMPSVDLWSFHTIHPLAVAALQLLISIGVLVAATPSSEETVNTGKNV